MENVASDSGRQGESYILQMRESPRPLRRYSRVVEACAIMLPPIGFFGSAWYIGPDASTEATTWFEIRTATPNSSVSRSNIRKNRAKCICRADSSPRPL